MKRFCLILTFLIISLVFCACASMDKHTASNDDHQPPQKHTISIPYYIPQEESIVTDEASGISYVNNMLMVVFRSDASTEDISSVIESIDGTVLEKIDLINQYQVQVPVQDLPGLSTLVAQVEENECVLFAHYDEAHESITNTYVPNDPWDADVDTADWSDSDIDGSNWWLEMIDAQAAWQYDDYFSPIKIGVVDVGFHNNHSDLSIYIPEQFENQNITHVHGTHVAGIIGAKHHNGKGICGIVKNCKLICIDVEPTPIQTQWDTESMIYIGLMQTLAEGARVINFSLGDNSDNVPTYETVDRRAKIASGYMASLLSNESIQDFVVVQSAGNSGRHALFNNYFASVTPDNCVTWGAGRASAESICDRIIVVGSVMNSASQTIHLSRSFSNYGNQVDVWAPGGSKAYDGTCRPDQGIYSTAQMNNYKAMAGTSMAAPVVTGVASLVWSINPDLPGNEVAEIVCKNTKGTVKHPNSPQIGGVVNAQLAVEEAIRLLEKNTDILASGDCNDNISWTLDSSGTLTFTGQGAMPDYGKTGDKDQPWYPHHSNIKRIVIGDGIEKLGWYNFAHCENLIEVVIPETLTDLGKGTFVNCTELKSITIPDSVTTIGWDVFFKCSSLADVKLSSNLKHIGYHAFFECTSLRKISIPQSVVEIGMNCFRGCTALEQIFFYGPAPTFVSGEFHDTHSEFMIYYISGMSGWTPSKWTAPDGTEYNTSIFEP